MNNPDCNRTDLDEEGDEEEIGYSNDINTPGDGYDDGSGEEK